MEPISRAKTHICVIMVKGVIEDKFARTKEYFHLAADAGLIKIVKLDDEDDRDNL